jgi:hypothetical protein
MPFIMVTDRFCGCSMWKGVLVTQPFGDFTEEDTIDENDIPLEAIDWDAVEELQRRMDEVNVIPDKTERKNAAKALVRELNGE